jgi:hypothetical protein
MIHHYHANCHNKMFYARWAIYDFNFTIAVRFEIENIATFKLGL